MIQRTPSSAPSPAAALLLILLVALLARGGALVAARDAVPVQDEKHYLMRAEALLEGRGYLGSYQSWVRHDHSPVLGDLPQYPGSYQPPGYPTFLAAILAATGGSTLAVKLVQVVLGTLSVALLYWIGSRWFDVRCGLLAAGIYAVYPNLIAFTHYLWSETLFLFLFLGLVGLLTTGAGVPSKRRAILAGALLGAGALTRALALPLAALLLAWLVLEHRRAWRPAAVRCLLVALVAALAIAPWTLRNHRLHGGFVLIDSNGPFNLWRGSDPPAYATRPLPPAQSYAWPFHAIPLAPVQPQTGARMVALVKDRLGKDDPTDLEVMAAARQLAWENIRSDPGAFLRRGAYKVVDMWNPTSFLLRHFRWGAYGPVPPGVESAVTLAAVLSYLAVMALAAVGAAASLRRSRTWLVLALALLCTAASFATFGLTRFRLPLMPLFMVLAGHGILQIRARLGADTAGRHA